MRKKNRFVKHKIEVFSAGCKICKDTIEAVRRLAGSEHEVMVVHDMHQYEVQSSVAWRPQSSPGKLIHGFIRAWKVL